MITCCSREESDAAVGSAREQPRLSGVKLAVKYSKVGHHVMAAQNFHGNDQRVFVEVAARKAKRTVTAAWYWQHYAAVTSRHMRKKSDIDEFLITEAFV